MFDFIKKLNFVPNNPEGFSFHNKKEESNITEPLSLECQEILDVCTQLSRSLDLDVLKVMSEKLSTRNETLKPIERDKIIEEISGLVDGHIVSQPNFITKENIKEYIDYFQKIGEYLESDKIKLLSEHFLAAPLILPQLTESLRTHQYDNLEELYASWPLDKENFKVCLLQVLVGMGHETTQAALNNSNFKTFIISKGADPRSLEILKGLEEDEKNFATAA